MENFVRNLLTEWRKLKLPFAEATFVAAVSGGADSVSLLLALYELKKLKKLNLRFVVAHYNHDLRGEESEKDEDFVKHLAAEFGYELALGKGNVSEKGNLEQNARRARYEFLANTAASLHARGILTAHTLNDQAETFLMNLIRGSGLEGLSGMKAIRSLKSEDESQILLVRPLLNWAKREDTENFCRLHEIEFRYDTMNEDLAFRRVRIRKVLLPLLEDFNPKIVETLAKTASLLRDEAELLSAAARRSDETAASPHGDALNLRDLREMSKPSLYVFLREWLKTNRGDLRNLDTKHMEAIESLIFSRKSGRIVELPGRESIIKQGGKLFFRK
ncbi:MAG TPA: tRNA lysidine(34) synthetase TilS [Pyrinomonadaceae bacterium]|jgi:tRNA(Ile)-lysidine synthase